MVSVVPSARLRSAMAPIASGRAPLAAGAHPPSPPARSPAGSAATEAAMAWAISAMVTSCSTSLRAGTSTVISGAAMPWIEVRVIPASKSRAANSSAMRASWSRPTGPVTTTLVTRSPPAALDARLLGLLGQGADLVERVLHVGAGARHVPARPRIRA
jgi:hypothetical protein